MIALLKALGIAAIGVVVAGATLWGALAIYYSNPPDERLRIGLATAFALGTVAAFLLLRNRWRTLMGFCAAFAQAPAALAAAATAQRALRAEAWGEVRPLRVRMALHAGAVEHRDGDYFGPPLNRVARLLDAGHGGQILLSQAAADLIRDTLTAGGTLRGLGAHRLKDLQQPEHLPLHER